MDGLYGYQSPARTTAKSHRPGVLQGDSGTARYDPAIAKTTSPGWSFGDVVGFEAARRGVPVKGVVLIDAPFPVYYVLSSNEFMAVIAGAFTRGGRTPIGRMIIAGGPYPPLVLLHNKDGIPPDAFLPYSVPWWMSEKETDPCLLADDWSGLVGAPMKLFRLPGTLFTTFATPHLGAVTQALVDGCAYLDEL
ncbi:uncharacterized protein ARMOST_11545 [Armillaria ostoyae]|uniref:Uncharacterized protein n=1 Tax=Armillaria ostoyae TaxID=47428 RepID=A0A284RHG1_ARMOS|nr:uncharacterized protein ARMOST_11545 [Armillaria ostoyae]